MVADRADAHARLLEDLPADGFPRWFAGLHEARDAGDVAAGPEVVLADHPAAIVDLEEPRRAGVDTEHLEARPASLGTLPVARSTRSAVTLEPSLSAARTRDPARSSLVAGVPTRITTPS